MRTASKVALIAGALLLVGCARQAPALPPEHGAATPAERLSQDDRSSPAMRLTCPQLARALEDNRREARELDAGIESQRGRNQAVIFIAGAAGAPFAAHSTAEKTRLDELQAERDRMDRIVVAKKCAA